MELIPSSIVGMQFAHEETVLHNLAYTGRRRRCRGLGCCAGVCWAMNAVNRNRSSTRKYERPADVRRTDPAAPCSSMLSAGIEARPYHHES